LLIAIPPIIFFGKSVGNLLFLLIVEVIIVPMFYSQLRLRIRIVRR